MLWLMLTGIAQATSTEVGIQTPVSGSVFSAGTAVVVDFEGVVFFHGARGPVEFWEGSKRLASVEKTAALASYGFSQSFALGAHRVEMRAPDNAGFTSAYVDFTVVSGVPPTTVLSSPKDGDSLAMKSDLLSVLVTAAATPVAPAKISKLEVLSDGKPIYATSAASITNIGGLGLVMGPHVMQVRATDSIGAIGYSNLVNITLTGTPPTSSITVPEQGGSYGATGGAATITVTGTAAGTTGASVKKIELLEGGTLLGQVTIESSPHIAKSFAQGAHSIEWRVTDGRGMVSSSFVDFTVVPAVPPTVTLTSPVEGAVIPMLSDTQSIRISGYGEAFHHAKIAKIEVLDGDTSIATGGATLDNILTSALKPGPHLIRLKATDSLGQITYSNGANVVLAGTLPAATLTLPENNGRYFAPTGTRSMAVTGTAAGTSGATIAKVELWERGTLLATAASPTSSVFNKPFALGAHSIEWRVTDSRGAASSVFADFTIIPAIAPEVEITSPAQGQVFPMIGTFYLPVSGSATASAASSDKAKIVKLEVLDGARVAYSTTTASTLSAAPVPGFTPGSHAIQLRVTDSVGSVSVTDPVNITLTSLPPTVAVTVPEQDGTYSGLTAATIAVTGTAYGTDGASRQ